MEELLKLIGCTYHELSNAPIADYVRIISGQLFALFR